MNNQDLNINKEYEHGFTTDIESIREFMARLPD